MPRLLHCLGLLLSTMLAFCSAYTTASNLHNPSDQAEHRILQVGYIEDFSPFVYAQADEEGIVYRGLAADMFASISDTYPQWDIQPVSFNSLHDGLQALSNAQIDILVGPIGMEEAHVYPINISHAYSLDTVILVAPKSNIDLITLLLKIKDHSSIIIQIVLLSAILIVFVGIIYWRAEYKNNSDFENKSTTEGLSISMFEIYSCFLRDLTYTPKTMIGRLITSVWVLYSVAAVTIIISILTSSILLIYQHENYKIRSPHEIIRQKIGYVDGHDLAKKSIEKYSGIPVAYNDFFALSAAMERHEISYFVADKIAIQNHSITNPQAKFNVTSIRLAYGLFGFGVANGDDNRLILQMINTELNAMRHSHKTSYICEKYLTPEHMMDCF